MKWDNRTNTLTPSVNVLEEPALGCVCVTGLAHLVNTITHLETYAGKEGLKACVH